jgi:hypothetical protein
LLPPPVGALFEVPLDPASPFDGEVAEGFDEPLDVSDPEPFDPDSFDPDPFDPDPFDPAAPLLSLDPLEPFDALELRLDPDLADSRLSVL